jgi:hypothetical protein
MDLREVQCKDMDWIQMAQLRNQCEQRTLENGKEPSDFIKSKEILH